MPLGSCIMARICVVGSVQLCSFDRDHYVIRSTSPPRSVAPSCIGSTSPPLEPRQEDLLRPLKFVVASGVVFPTSGLWRDASSAALARCSADAGRDPRSRRSKIKQAASGGADSGAANEASHVRFESNATRLIRRHCRLSPKRSKSGPDSTVLTGGLMLPARGSTPTPRRPRRKPRAGSGIKGSSKRWAGAWRETARSPMKSWSTSPPLTRAKARRQASPSDRSARMSFYPEAR
jgi:hypothetical protein